MIIKDLHIHTKLSDGKLTPEEVYSLAYAKGYQAGISDHCGEGSFQINGNDQFEQYLNALEGLPVLKSAELDLGTKVSISRELLDRCDYLIGGVHSIGDLNFFDSEARLPPSAVLINKMLDLIEIKARQHRFDILAHPGLLPLKLRPAAGRILDKEWSQRLIALALKYDFALEINSRWELPYPEIVSDALAAGARFSLGSDGHCRETACRLDYSLAMVKELNIPEDRMFQV